MLPSRVCQMTTKFFWICLQYFLYLVNHRKIGDICRIFACCPVVFFIQDWFEWQIHIVIIMVYYVYLMTTTTTTQMINAKDLVEIQQPSPIEFGQGHCLCIQCTFMNAKMVHDHEMSTTTPQQRFWSYTLWSAENMERSKAHEPDISCPSTMNELSVELAQRLVVEEIFFSSISIQLFIVPIHLCVYYPNVLLKNLIFVFVCLLYCV